MALTSGLCVARALDDLAPAIRRRRRPWKRQSLHAVVSLSSLRQSDLDRCAADRDAINPVANVGLPGGTVCGQLADGFSDERFDLGGGNADDRSRFALVALQSRLRDVIAVISRRRGKSVGSAPKPPVCRLPKVAFDSLDRSDAW
jgi:hypothetical protein